MYTVPFLSRHALAAARGDGLHPELLALFERLAAASEAGPPVVDFSRYQTDGVLQSGAISVRQRANRAFRPAVISPVTAECLPAPRCRPWQFDSKKRIARSNVRPLRSTRTAAR